MAAYSRPVSHPVSPPVGSAHETFLAHARAFHLSPANGCAAQRCVQVQHLVSRAEAASTPQQSGRAFLTRGLQMEPGYK